MSEIKINNCYSNDLSGNIFQVKPKDFWKTQYPLGSHKQINELCEGKRTEHIWVYNSALNTMMDSQRFAEIQQNVDSTILDDLNTSFINAYQEDQSQDRIQSESLNTMLEQLQVAADAARTAQCSYEGSDQDTPNLYLGNIHDRDLEDKDIKKFVELSKLYVSNSHYLDYLNFQFLKNVYTICKGYGIKFYWLNFESNRFQKFFTDEREVYWENEQQLLDLCINPKQIVRNYIKEAKLAQDTECSCGHFNDYAQPYISAYLLKGYNERKNS